MILEAVVVGGFQGKHLHRGLRGTPARRWLVDPGGENAPRVGPAWEKLGLTLEGIVNTHGHVDHVSGVYELQNSLKLPFHIHSAEQVILQALPQVAAYFGVGNIQTPAADSFLKDGEILSLGNMSCKVIHTPGHTPGGVCLYFEKEKKLLSGDTLFAMSVGRTDLPGGSWPQLSASIADKLFALPDGRGCFFPVTVPAPPSVTKRNTIPSSADRLTRRDARRNKEDKRWAVLPIVTIPHPVLRQKAEPVEVVTDEIRKLAEGHGRNHVCRAGYRIGRAPSWGVSKRLIVVDVAHQDEPAQLYQMVNPVITSKTGP